MSSNIGVKGGLGKSVGLVASRDAAFGDDSRDRLGNGHSVLSGEGDLRHTDGGGDGRLDPLEGLSGTTESVHDIRDLGERGLGLQAWVGHVKGDGKLVVVTGNCVSCRVLGSGVDLETRGSFGYGSGLQELELLGSGIVGQVFASVIVKVISLVTCFTSTVDDGVSVGSIAIRWVPGDRHGECSISASKKSNLPGLGLLSSLELLSGRASLARIISEGELVAVRLSRHESTFSVGVLDGDGEGVCNLLPRSEGLSCLDGDSPLGGGSIDSELAETLA